MPMKIMLIDHMSHFEYLRSHNTPVDNFLGYLHKRFRLSAGYQSNKHVCDPSLGNAVFKVFTGI